MSEKWIVVQTQPRRERWAAENIERLGYQFYLPMIQVMGVVRGNLRVARLEPLFHRHMFVRSDEGKLQGLKGCWGVSGVIMMGERPGFVPVKEIQKIKAMEGEPGIVTLPPANRFAPGDRVRVSGGSMIGCTGVWEGQAPKDRNKVLLDVLGGKTKVLIPDEFLEPI